MNILKKKIILNLKNLIKIYNKSYIMSNKYDIISNKCDKFQYLIKQYNKEIYNSLEMYNRIDVELKDILQKEKFGDFEISEADRMIRLQNITSKKLVIFRDLVEITKNNIINFC